MGTKLDTPWPEVAELAASQHGAIARRQLLALGITPRSINRAIASGRLHRIYRGVYAVGHKRISLHGRFMAAVLACGDEARLSHRSAGELWGLRFDYWKIEVTAPGGPKGILVHRTRRVPTATIRDGIPLTRPGRTLVDLADVVSAARLQRAFDDAERLRILDVDDIHPIPGRKGEANIRGLIEQHRAVAETKSELERRFAQFLRDEALPWPVFNTLVEGIEVDVLWREQRVIVELDSYEFHGKARKPFEDDREKDIKLQLAGYKVIRVTSRKIERRAELRAQLDQLLSTPA